MYFIKNVFLIFLVSCSAFALSAASNYAVRSFWHPTYLGQRLAYCDKNQCGAVIARTYCKQLGYDGLKKSVIAHNVGLTRILSSKQQCRGWPCDGFLLIQCKKNLVQKIPKAYYYRERRFVYPRFNDYRVAWCYSKNKGCGAGAANSFCSRMGYLKAKHFIKQSGIAATKAMGNQELCFGPKCSAFKTILCYR